MLLDPPSSSITLLFGGGKAGNQIPAREMVASFGTGSTKMLIPQSAGFLL